MTGDIGITNAGITSIQPGVIVNADVNASAAIAYSKLNLTGMIVNNDISASASIVYSKLALTNSIVGTDINPSAAIVATSLSASSFVKLSTDASVLAFYGASGAGNNVTFHAPSAITTTQTYTLPLVPGSSGQFLQTDRWISGSVMGHSRRYRYHPTNGRRYRRSW